MRPRAGRSGVACEAAPLRGWKWRSRPASSPPWPRSRGRGYLGVSCADDIDTEASQLRERRCDARASIRNERRSPRREPLPGQLNKAGSTRRFSRSSTARPAALARKVRPARMDRPDLLVQPAPKGQPAGLQKSSPAARRSGVSMRWRVPQGPKSDSRRSRSLPPLRQSRPCTTSRTGSRAVGMCRWNSLTPTGRARQSVHLRVLSRRRASILGQHRQRRRSEVRGERHRNRR